MYAWQQNDQPPNSMPGIRGVYIVDFLGGQEAATTVTSSSVWLLNMQQMHGVLMAICWGLLIICSVCTCPRWKRLQGAGSAHVRLAALD